MRSRSDKFNCFSELKITKIFTSYKWKTVKDW